MDFSVPDMTCGHCTAAIEKALRAADPAATVACDIPARRVTVNTALPAQGILDTLKSAGYDATPA